MSRSCPSCGSAVDATAKVCPLCGESLAGAIADSRPIDPAPVESPIPVVPPVPAAAPVAVESAARQICPECGAANAAGAGECSVCGEPLAEAATARHASNRAAASRTKGAGSRIYMYATIALLTLTGLVFLVSRREEVTSAPRPEAAAAGSAADSAHGQQMPHNHPPVQQGPPQPTPEQQSQIAELEAQLKSTPKDDSTRMKLGDLFLDVGRYTDAAAMYRSMLDGKANAEAQIRLATAISATGDNDGAIAELNRLMKAEPKNQRAALTMAVMYVNKRDRDSLSIWLHNVLAIDATTEEGQQAAMFIEKMKEIAPAR